MRLRLAIPLLSLILSRPVQAQDTPATNLDTVVVSASKAPEASRAVQSVTVVTGDELRAAGIEWVGDALRLVPGAVVARGGSFGSVTSLFLRGGETRYAKVLLDGVPVNAVGGYFDFSDLSTENVERIEVVRGPASVVHGADAMTGVVHIITRRGRGPPSAEVDARGGTYRTRDISASLLGGDRVQYSLGTGRFTTDGTLPFNNEYRNKTASGSVRFLRGEHGSITASARYGSALYHYPTDFAGVVEDSNSFRDQRRFTVGLDAAHRLRERVDLRLLVAYNDVLDNTDDVDPPPPWIGGADEIHSRYSARTNRRSAELRAATEIARGVKLTTGIEYVRERERTRSSEAPVGSPLIATSDFAGVRETRVVFAELAANRGMLDYAISGRTDTPSDFATSGTWRAAAGWSIAALRLHVGAGTAFNAPAFSQLLPTEFTVGNPDLDPEKAFSHEIGAALQALHGRLTLKATRFDQTFRDMIHFVNGGPPDFLGSFANLARVRSDGWELEVRALPTDGWSATASLTLLDPRVHRLHAGYDGPLVEGQRLVRRARQSAVATLSYSGSSRGGASLVVRHVGVRPDLDFRAFPSPSIQLPAYTVADVASRVRVLRRATGEEVSLTARVQNLFDTGYEEILYYPAPGRTILVGLHAAFALR